MIKIGIPKNLCGVYVNQNIYGLKAPYENCKIICSPEKPHKLQECVFSGTLEDCEKFVKENCTCDK
ncbi:MAG: hypothetical protein JXA68_11285 [Ignavibacteriales bacterium]|nr:hypothetical protein [Ignavibacteriales bacterium]